jgi:hypothetical protein
MNAACSSESYVSTYKNTHYYNPYNHDLTYLCKATSKTEIKFDAKQKICFAEFPLNKSIHHNEYSLKWDLNLYFTPHTYIYVHW